MNEILSNSYIQDIITAYNEQKSLYIKDKAVYMLSTTQNNALNAKPVITSLSDSMMRDTLSTADNLKAIGIYNNSTKTEHFHMGIMSELSSNDGLIVFQYNDALPDFNHLLVSKYQEMSLSETVKVELKPNDCIIIAAGTKNNNSKPVVVNIDIVGINAVRKNTEMDNTRKIIFGVLAIVLLIAICMLLYSLMNKKSKMSFRRRR